MQMEFPSSLRRSKFKPRAEAEASVQRYDTMRSKSKTFFELFSRTKMKAASVQAQCERLSVRLMFSCLSGDVHAAMFGPVFEFVSSDSLLPF